MHNYQSFNLYVALAASSSGRLLTIKLIYGTRVKYCSLLIQSGPYRKHRVSPELYWLCLGNPMLNVC